MMRSESLAARARARGDEVAELCRRTPSGDRAHISEARRSDRATRRPRYPRVARIDGGGRPRRVARRLPRRGMGVVPPWPNGHGTGCLREGGRARTPGGPSGRLPRVAGHVPSYGSTAAGVARLARPERARPRKRSLASHGARNGARDDRSAGGSALDAARTGPSSRSAAGASCSAGHRIESTIVSDPAGDAASPAESSAPRGARIYEGLGDEAFLSSAAARYAEALYSLDRLDEADAWATRAGELRGRSEQTPSTRCTGEPVKSEGAGAEKATSAEGRAHLPREAVGRDRRDRPRTRQVRATRTAGPRRGAPSSSGKP